MQSRGDDAVYLADEGAAVTGLDGCEPVEPLQRGQPGGHPSLVEQSRAAVACDPDLRLALLPLAAAAEADRGQEDQANRDEAPVHVRALERTAPLRVARTSRPLCAPRHARAFFVLTARPEPG